MGICAHPGSTLIYSEKLPMRKAHSAISPKIMNMPTGLRQLGWCGSIMLLRFR